MRNTNFQYNNHPNHLLQQQYGQIPGRMGNFSDAAPQQQQANPINASLRPNFSAQPLAQQSQPQPYHHHNNIKQNNFTNPQQFNTPNIPLPQQFQQQQIPISQIQHSQIIPPIVNQHYQQQFNNNQPLNVNISQQQISANLNFQQQQQPILNKTQSSTENKQYQLLQMPSKEQVLQIKRKSSLEQSLEKIGKINQQKQQSHTQPSTYTNQQQHIIPDIMEIEREKEDNSFQNQVKKSYAQFSQKLNDNIYDNKQQQQELFSKTGLMVSGQLDQLIQRQKQLSKTYNPQSNFFNMQCYHELIQKETYTTDFNIMDHVEITDNLINQLKSNLIPDRFALIDKEQFNSNTKESNENQIKNTQQLDIEEVLACKQIEDIKKIEQNKTYKSKAEQDNRILYIDSVINKQVKNYFQIIEDQTQKILGEKQENNNNNQSYNVMQNNNNGNYNQQQQLEQEQIQQQKNNKRLTRNSSINNKNNNRNRLNSDSLNSDKEENTKNNQEQKFSEISDDLYEDNSNNSDEDYNLKGKSRNKKKNNSKKRLVKRNQSKNYESSDFSEEDSDPEGKCEMYSSNSINDFINNPKKNNKKGRNNFKNKNGSRKYQNEIGDDFSDEDEFINDFNNAKSQTKQKKKNQNRQAEFEDNGEEDEEIFNEEIIQSKKNSGKKLNQSNQEQQQQVDAIEEEENKPNEQDKNNNNNYQNKNNNNNIDSNQSNNNNLNGQQNSQTNPEDLHFQKINLFKDDLAKFKENIDKIQQKHNSQLRKLYIAEQKLNQTEIVGQYANDLYQFTLNEFKL